MYIFRHSCPGYLIPA